MLGYGLYPPLSLDWHFPPAEFIVALRLWLGIPVFSEADPALSAAINLLTVLVTTLLAAAMDLCALDVIMPYVTLFIMHY